MLIVSINTLILSYENRLYHTLYRGTPFPFKGFSPTH
nr:MAG TPA: hypothetical protein [Caudoviricetes sp.]